ncbi:MAG: phosphoribosylanthranilate isomerase [Akkermansiaceae bacterium]
MMSDLRLFKISKNEISLKICGITLASDAEQLIELGVHALGVNFWPSSKRYIDPDDAAYFLKSSEGKITRVGVFVNADPELPRRLLDQGLIDFAQFHGDESIEYCQAFAKDGLPFIKALGVKNASSLELVTDYGASALLLDTPAPGVYGGTGEIFDWTIARAFIQKHPNIPVLLAGGITPRNAEEAIKAVHPAGLDVASGAEISPGVKDFDKVKALLKAARITVE